jgi:hypothetical protein
MSGQPSPGVDAQELQSVLARAKLDVSSALDTAIQQVGVMFPQIHESLSIAGVERSVV